MNVGIGELYWGQAMSQLPSRRHFNYVSAWDMHPQAVDDYFENKGCNGDASYGFDYSKIDAVLARTKTTKKESYESTI
ncbi:hypothetical protein EBZ39_14420 [bacterium]|nr:hypothetical protein [bacterium]